MRMETLKAKEPEAVNVTKARITAYSREDAKKAADLISKGWKHSQIKEIRPTSPLLETKTVSYYVLMWN